MDIKFESDQLQGAQQFMASICGEHSLDIISRDKIDFHYDGIKFPNKKMAIGMIQYGAPVAINTAQLKSYSISLPVAGHQKLLYRGEYYHSDSDKGIIVSNADHQELLIDQGCHKLQIVLPETSINTILSEILNTQITDPLIFNSEMSMHNEVISGWWKYVQNFYSMKNFYNNVHGFDLISNDYENFIIKSLLFSQENNYSAHLNNILEISEDNYIKRIRNYMVAHAIEELDFNHIAKMHGVSKTKLFADFKQMYDETPVSYLKNYRLLQIKKELSLSSSKQSISALAYKWGFNHLSRFSQEYREVFGENPSDTLRKGIH